MKNGHAIRWDLLESDLESVDPDAIIVCERSVDHEGDALLRLEENDDTVVSAGMISAPGFVGACPWRVVVQCPDHVVVGGHDKLQEKVSVGCGGV